MATFITKQSFPKQDSIFQCFVVVHLLQVVGIMSYHPRLLRGALPMDLRSWIEQELQSGKGRVSFCGVDTTKWFTLEGRKGRRDPKSSEMSVPNFRKWFKELF